ncbi:hypothetical protein HB370_13030 [Streptomyces sp. DSM 40868]|uniref:hypothetical protein n=1 Tax=Streptomyces TaxID=1883 RepID=UPI0004C64329|nr:MULTISPECIES: hypothetical protein [Streptomyces]QIS70819.1 hypothetical protein HB370_13030 [Streptomyces sp. DSM 40868]
MDNGREFSDAGAEWWENIIQELAYELDSACPGTERFLPEDLGNPTLVQAMLMVRTALRDQRGTAATDIADELYSLWPNREPPLEDCADLVASLLRHLHEHEHALPLLRSWRTSDLWTGFLQLYTARRAAAVGALRTARELDERWMLDPCVMSDGSLDRPLDPGARWQSFAAYLRTTQRDNVTGAALGLLDRAPVARHLTGSAQWLGEYLGEARHLVALGSEAQAAEYVRRRADELSSGTGGGLWRDVAAAAADYARVRERVREGLTTYEQELFRAAHDDRKRDQELMLETYLVRDGDAGPHPRPLLPGSQAPAPGWMTTMIELRAGSARGTTPTTFTWHSLPGHTPWWFCAVRPGPEERMAARLGHDGRIQFEVDKERPGDLLIGLPDDEPESFLHHLRFQYDENDPDDLSRLLMLATTGWARLDILAARKAGGLRTLRTIRVDVPEPLRDLCGEYAYARLKRLSGMVDKPDAEAPAVGQEPRGAGLRLDGRDEGGASLYEVPPAEQEQASAVFDGGLFQRDDTLF